MRLCQRLEKIVYYLKNQLRIIFAFKYGSFENKTMAEYLTKYPKTISFLDVICGSLKGIVNIDNHSNVEQLHVPVIKNADELSFADIEKNIKSISEKARDGKLTVEDLQGGTFTISNGGVYGSMLSTPILNPPQSGVLGMHNVIERPVVINGEILIRPMMYLALSYDHRIIDGKDSVSFLKCIKENLEDPRRLFLDL